MKMLKEIINCRFTLINSFLAFLLGFVGLALLCVVLLSDFLVAGFRLGVLSLILRFSFFSFLGFPGFLRVFRFIFGGLFLAGFLFFFSLCLFFFGGGLFFGIFLG